MKIFLIFEDKEILIETSNDISVKALKKEISSHLSTSAEKLSLMSEKEQLDDNQMINKDDSTKKFILFKPVEAAACCFPSEQEKDFVLEDNNEIEDLIMKVTGATKKIASKKGKIKQKLNSLESKFEVMNQLFSRYTGPRSSSLLRQEFENIIAQTNQLRDSLNFDEQSVSSLGGSVSEMSNPLSMNSTRPVRSAIRSRLEDIRPNFVEGQGSTRTNNFSHYIPQINPFRRMNVQADLVLTKNLVDMGFSEDQAKRALTLTGNNLNAAADLILSNENLDDLSNPFSSSSHAFPGKLIVHLRVHSHKKQVSRLFDSC